MNLQRYFWDDKKPTRSSVAKSLIRTRAKERRLAAVREAGHVVIARRVGLEIVSAWIASGGGQGEWIGQTQFRNANGTDKFALRMVGVAGSVATHLWCGRSIEDIFPEGSMSECDWHLAGYSVNANDAQLMDAVRGVAYLLVREGPGWQELIAETRWLILDSRKLLLDQSKANSC
jgi:hypothetical protein